MARNEYTPEKIDSIANELIEAAETLKSLSSAMRDGGMPHVLIHGTTAENFHLPAVLEWIGKTSLDTRTQLRAYLSGVQSRAELNKKYNDKQKLAAAKKPFTPKKPKKTS